MCDNFPFAQSYKIRRKDEKKFADRKNTSLPSTHFPNTLHFAKGENDIPIPCFFCHENQLAGHVERISAKCSQRVFQPPSFQEPGHPTDELHVVALKTLYLRVVPYVGDTQSGTSQAVRCFHLIDMNTRRQTTILHFLHTRLGP